MTMLHLFMKKGPWFRAKRYGYGVGLPLKWQGWALIAFYLLALAGIGLLSKQDTDFPRAVAFVVFLIVTAPTHRGRLEMALGRSPPVSLSCAARSNNFVSRLLCVEQNSAMRRNSRV
jgi:hypothetical protein